MTEMMVPFFSFLVNTLRSKSKLKNVNKVLHSRRTQRKTAGEKETKKSEVNEGSQLEKENYASVFANSTQGYRSQPNLPANHGIQVSLTDISRIPLVEGSALFV